MKMLSIDALQWRARWRFHDVIAVVSQLFNAQWLFNGGDDGFCCSNSVQITKPCRPTPTHHI
jgi:hypothetical protein